MIKKLFLAIILGILLVMFGLLLWGNICSMKMDNATYLITIFALMFASFILIVGSGDYKQLDEQKSDFDIIDTKYRF